MTRGRTTTVEWRTLRKAFLKQGIEQGKTICPLCRTWMNYDQAKLPNSPELDHITPYAQGGTDDPSNLRLICRLCNGKRGGKLGRAMQLHKKLKPIEPETKFEW